MGREVKRVPLDFDAPYDITWQGYVMPKRLDEPDCPDCELGYSPRGQELYEQWYGKRLFDPRDNGSEPLTDFTPAVRAFAERNVSRAPEYYGIGEFAIQVEATRLANLWNGMWSHHLNQDDVDALVAAGRLMDFTHTFTRETRWQPKDPPYRPTAAEVNEWNISTMGHDGINAGVCVRARCEREGIESTCATCGGHGSIEAYKGQRAEADAWERTEPPTGEGWQLWQTVSDAPYSPVFATAEQLAVWMSGPDNDKDDNISYDMALRFIRDVGWAPSMIVTNGVVESGVESAVRS